MAWVLNGASLTHIWSEVRHMHWRWVALADAPYLAVTAVNAVISINYGIFTVVLPLWITTHTDVPRWTVGVMMLNHIHEETIADRLKAAYNAVLEEGQVRTRDLGGNASTDQFADAIIAKLR